MRLSNFMLGILVVSFFISAFVLIMANVAENNPDTVGTTNFSSYEKVEEISEHSRSIKDRISNISSEKRAFDIIGRLFGSGIDTVQLTYSSLELGVDMADDAFSGVNDSGSLPLGSSGTLVSSFFITGIIILLFIAIVLTLFLRWKA